jgi:hypothetical protein
MLHDEIKKNQLKKSFELVNQTRDSSHKIKITLKQKPNIKRKN